GMVNVTGAADSLANADINRVVGVATAAREPGLTVELGGKAISNTEQPPLSSASAIGIGAAAVILFIAFGSLFATALPIVTAVAGVGRRLVLMAPLTPLMAAHGMPPAPRALYG